MPEVQTIEPPAGEQRLPERSRAIPICEDFVRDIADYLIFLFGEPRVRRIVHKSTQGTLLEKVQVRKTLNLSETRGRIAQVPEGEAGTQKVLAAFHRLYTDLYQELERAIGKKFATGWVEKRYEEVKSKEDLGLLAHFLAIVPENLLERERLRLLPRNELEEVQVDLTKANRELHETTKLLIKRDLELTQTNERLRTLDAVKSQFVSVAAHQLRTPLAGIKWTLYALLEEQVGKLNGEQKKFARDAYKSTVRLIDLVNDLLDAARLEEGRFGFKMERQDFLPVAKKVCQEFEKQAQEKGVRLSVNFPEGKLPDLVFDKEKIGIVLENLVDNAIKYTPPGGSIAVSVQKEKEGLSCAVADTGIGLPAEQVERVFSKFFRAENAQLSQTSGTGLGLYLAKNIVEHHGGAMFFQTKENKGSTFTFTLPLVKP